MGVSTFQRGARLCSDNVLFSSVFSNNNKKPKRTPTFKSIKGKKTCSAWLRSRVIVPAATLGPVPTGPCLPLLLLRGACSPEKTSLPSFHSFLSLGLGLLYICKCGAA